MISVREHFTAVRHTHTTITDFDENGSYFMERMFSAFPSDVFLLLCLNSLCNFPESNL